MQERLILEPPTFCLGPAMSPSQFFHFGIATDRAKSRMRLASRGLATPCLSVHGTVNHLIIRRPQQV